MISLLVNSIGDYLLMGDFKVVIDIPTGEKSMDKSQTGCKDD